MSAPEELERLYIPWHGHKQEMHSISKGVAYLGYFGVFGEVWARHKIWTWRQSALGPSKWGSKLLRSQAFQEKALDATLEDLRDCVILSTTPSYYSQFQSACLLRSRGFKLLAGLCYKHPAYTELSKYKPEHPGVPDRYLHWEHIWWKVQGHPTELGVPISGASSANVNNCGVDVAVGEEGIQAHDKGDRKPYLAVGWMPRGTLFPKGWKRFFSGVDYKLGVNFETGLKNVQKCPHQFDLKVFEGWEPDFETWSPA